MPKYPVCSVDGSELDKLTTRAECQVFWSGEHLYFRTRGRFETEEATFNRDQSIQLIKDLMTMVGISKEEL